MILDLSQHARNCSRCVRLAQGAPQLIGGGAGDPGSGFDQIDAGRWHQLADPGAGSGPGAAMSEHKRDLVQPGTTI